MQIIGKQENKMAGQLMTGGRAVEPGHTPRDRIIQKNDLFIGWVPNL